MSRRECSRRRRRRLEGGRRKSSSLQGLPHLHSTQGFHSEMRKNDEESGRAPFHDGMDSVSSSFLHSSSKSEERSKVDTTSTILPTSLLYQDADFSAISLNLKALLSPKRDWVRCSICQAEVSWMARAERFRQQQHIHEVLTLLSFSVSHPSPSLSLFSLSLFISLSIPCKS